MPQQGLAKLFLENMLWIFGFITAAFVLIRVLKDYQDRKLAETSIKEKESSVGETAVKKLVDEMKRLEVKIDSVDQHCEERDEQQRRNVSNFFEQTWNILRQR